jgi:hypothetical protein
MVITNKAKDAINHQQSDKVKYAPQKCWGTVMAPNVPDLVQAFQRKRWVKSDFNPSHPSSITIKIYLLD